MVMVRLLHWQKLCQTGIALMLLSSASPSTLVTPYFFLPSWDEGADVATDETQTCSRILPSYSKEPCRTTTSQAMNERTLQDDDN